MAFTLDVEAPRYGKMRKYRASEAVKVPVFDRYQKSSLNQLKQSIEDAENRYGTDERAARPQSKPTPSKNWKVEGTDELHTGDDEDGKESQELVLVYVKAGAKKLKVMPDEKGEPAVESRITHRALLPTLRGLQSQVEAMTKDSEFGKIFHTEAIKQARPKRKLDAEKRYNVSSDLYE